MLDNDIVTLAALVGNIILGWTCLKQRQSYVRFSAEPSDRHWKSSTQSSEIDIALPVLPGLPEIVAVSGPIPPVAEPTRVVRPGNLIRRRAFIAPDVVEKTCVTAPRAAELLIEYMNAEGLTGVFAAAEIDAYWQTTVELYDLEFLAAQFVREALSRHCLGQKRLNTPQYIEIRQRTGQSRAVLYRIPKCRAVSGSDPAVPETGAAGSVMATVAGPGQKPAATPPAGQAASRGISAAAQKRQQNQAQFGVAA